MRAWFEYVLTAAQMSSMPTTSLSWPGAMRWCGFAPGTTCTIWAMSMGEDKVTT